ncbi:MAG: PTS sugar transporter subunit IIA [Thermodesulfobacteriota bacterium]|nr:PTS sugar transporter subunit IIA [Thermodesulfobacteriota bacterium]
MPFLAARTKAEVLKELAEVAASEYPGLKVDDIVSVLQEREHLGTTGKGGGFAIPHGKIKGLEKIFICFGRSVDGVLFDALDRKSVYFFFFLLAPEEESEPYLECLARLTRFLNNSYIRTMLMNAAGESECREILERSE